MPFDGAPARSCSRLSGRRTAARHRPYRGEQHWPERGEPVAGRAEGRRFPVRHGGENGRGLRAAVPLSALPSVPVERRGGGAATAGALRDGPMTSRMKDAAGTDLYPIMFAKVFLFLETVHCTRVLWIRKGSL
jgi:hypothetical protein